jgi:proteasome lid subunit RPN8/RPN11
MALRLAQSDYERIVVAAQEGYPLEVCGLMAGRANEVMRLYPVYNRLESATAYEMELAEQVTAMLELEEQGWEMIAVYHSHPRGPDVPSPADIALAYYPGVVQVIISLADRPQPSVRAFTVDEGRVEEVVLEIG